MKLFLYSPEAVIAIAELDLRREQLFWPLYQPCEDVSVKGAENNLQIVEAERFLEAAPDFIAQLNATVKLLNCMQKSLENIKRIIQRINKKETDKGEI